MPLHEPKPGERVKAQHVAEIVRHLRGANRIAGGYTSSTGTITRPIVSSGGGGGTATANVALIASKTGSEPPYRYAAEEATMDVDGTWTVVPAGAAYNNLFVTAEQAPTGYAVNPLVVGTPVVIWQPDASVDAYICTAYNSRGTY